jgi:hypothetical protein
MSEYKRILINRGGQVHPMILKSGDQYDSVIQVYNPDGKVILTSPYVNTDYTIGTAGKGGIIAEGQELAGIVGRRKTGVPAIWIFRREFIGQVRKIEDMTQDMTVIKSLVPNPNHDNRLEVAITMIHAGGLTRDNSLACVTVHPDYYTKLMDLFRVGDTMEIDVVRNRGWIAPAFYEGR